MLHVLKFDPGGTGHCLYTEAVNLALLGDLEIVRASTLEFNNVTQLWEVRDVERQLMFTHPFRSVCAAWEQQYFNR
jgi:hypothetical protein